MSVEQIPTIGKLRGIEELKPATDKLPFDRAQGGSGFTDALKEAIETVDGLQKQSEAAQASFARGDQVDLHDVLIRIEEAEIAFKAMMEVRTKLVQAYQDVMRMGSGG